MLTVEVGASGDFRVLAREKEMVRLGAGGFARGKLGAAACARGLAALRKYARRAEARGVERIVAVATSAVREASNGPGFLARVGRETGVWPRVISGEEEARLIYLAALHSIHLEGRRVLVIDVGGGSTELALGAGERLEWAVSEKIGLLRLAERFASDPLTPRDERLLAAQVEAAVAPHAERVRRLGFDVAVGTSGTILALGALAHTLDSGREPGALHHLAVGADSLRRVRRRLTASSLPERLRLRGLDPARADVIAVGAVLVDVLLQRLGVKELLLCEWALREGLLLDHLRAHHHGPQAVEPYPDVRRRSVRSLAERFAHDADHARQVSRLAQALFDATRERHGLGRTERRLLEHAALLHDVGRYVAQAGHHKHGGYLVRHGGLRGFGAADLEVLAQVVRYHRGARPRKRHAGYAALPRGSRRAVRVLAGLLRLANALDHGQPQAVRSLSGSEEDGVLVLRVRAPTGAGRAWGRLGRRLALLERVLGVPLRLELAALAPPAEGAAARKV